MGLDQWLPNLPTPHQNLWGCFPKYRFLEFRPDPRTRTFSICTRLRFDKLLGMLRWHTGWPGAPRLALPPVTPQTLLRVLPGGSALASGTYLCLHTSSCFLFPLPPGGADSDRAKSSSTLLQPGLGRAGTLLLAPARASSGRAKWGQMSVHRKVCCMGVCISADEPSTTFLFLKIDLNSSSRLHDLCLE